MESHRDAPAALAMTSDPQLWEQSPQGEEVEILNLKRSKLQKRRPPARRRPCRASSLRFLHHMESARSANEAKSNKSVPPQQPAAKGSLHQDTDGVGEGSACSPENALVERPISH